MPVWLVTLLLISPLLMLWHSTWRYSRKLRIDLNEFLAANRPIFVKLWLK